MSLNMYGICSVCLIYSPKKLTPLFVEIENCWESTGLLEMLEIILGKKVIREHESMLAVCNKCVQKISTSYDDDDFKPLKKTSEFFTVKFPSLSSAEEEENRRKKIRPADELRVIKYEEPKNEDYINSLSLDCLAKIFMYFPENERLMMEEVCQRWKDASEIAWYDIKEFNTVPYFILFEAQESVKKIIRRCGHHLKELSINGDFDSSILTTVKEYCEDLTKITVQLNDKMSEDDFEDAFSGMNKLKTICLVVGAYERGIQSINFPKVLSSFSEDISTISFSTGDKKSVPLQYFQSSLDKFNALTQLTFYGFALDSNIMREISRKKTLEKLIFKFCSCQLGALLNSDLPNLQELEFFFATNYGDESLISFAMHCPNVKKLDLRHSVQLTNDSLIEILNWNQLEYLNLSYIDLIRDDVFVVITVSCKNLITLDLSGCFDLSAVGLQNLAELENLECLILRGLIYVNDSVISSIVVKLKKLKALNLAGCRSIGRPGLKKLASLINLEELHLDDIKNFNADIIFSITNNCKKIKKLSLYDTNVTRRCIKKVTNLKNLECLNLGKMGVVDDVIISRIVDKCKKIKELEISHCLFVSLTVIHKVIAKCGDLECLKVDSIPIETIVFAVDVTKRRTNKVVLTIVSNNIRDQYESLKEKSRFLKVRNS